MSPEVIAGPLVTGTVGPLIAAAFLLSILLWGLYKIRVTAMRKKEKMLEAELAARTRALQETRAQLILSEKMASLGQLTAGIAHEIRNPLNFVINFADLSRNLSKELRETIEKEKTALNGKNIKTIEEILDDLEQNVARINEHGKRIDGIVRGMLLHSRGKEGEFQVVDLNPLLEENTNLVYHSMRAQDQSFSVKIEKDFDPAAGRVDIIPQDFSRAFLNIVSNACYAANEKRKKNPIDYSPLVSIKTKNLDEKIEIAVEDNGGGIPPDEMDKIFKPFYTTKPVGTGTGLGLAIAHEIITKGHRGEIQVESKEGRFTRFTMTLPKTGKQS